MNFTNKVASLLIWFWTTFIIPALQLVKTQAAAAAAAVQSNLDAINQTIQQQIVVLQASITSQVEGVSNTLGAQINQVSSALTDLDGSISDTNSALSTFQSSTNSSISTINSNISNLESRIVTGFVDQVALKVGAMTYDAATQTYSTTGGDLLAEDALPGLYTLYLEEGSDYQQDEEGIVKIQLENFPVKSVDGTDELSIVWNGAAITSVRLVAKKDPILDPIEIQGIVADYMAANPFSIVLANA